ncbi:MAG: hypothetical protein M1823_003896 [Watsoniomyces obsoletus]|nr:MAG: hypothetical protein M1823_003896 [Watsoniomyces obsoletus]
MLFRVFRRRRRFQWNYARLILFVIIISIILDYITLSRTFSRQEQHINDAPPPPLPLSDKIFIASTLWHSEVTLRSYWSEALLRLARDLGPENIYVSIYGSSSFDDTHAALRDLDQELARLNVPRTVILDQRTHADEIAKPPSSEGWIRTSRGLVELRRIPYLSRLRNASLAPLYTQSAKGITYPKILFLNDVVFGTDDVRRLLDTRGGHYAAACSQDFSRPPAFYDTFALRDSEGDPAITSTWPYFRSTVSRDALIRGDPVPVQSCWNGMVVFDAEPFYNPSPSPFSTATHTIDTTRHPLEFRGIEDSLAEYHLEGSECCIIHFDNPLTRTKGVWMNPGVRVGYSIPAYEVVKSLPSSSSSSSPVSRSTSREVKTWPSFWQKYKGIWKNRIVRWFTPQGIAPRWWRRYTISSRLRRWKKQGGGGQGGVHRRHQPAHQVQHGAEEVGKNNDGRERKREEPAMNCLIDEMQVLVENGWAHV